MAIVFGGGGAANGLGNLVVQLGALAVLAIHRKSVEDFLLNAPMMLRVLALASMAVPLLQLVPLPAQLWSALPRRELVSEALMVAGEPAGMWRPFSVHLARTLVAFIGTLAPFTMIVLVSGIGREVAGRLLLVFGVMAFICALLGFVQISQANDFAMPYDGVEGTIVLYSLFANRNSAGVFFVLGCMALIVAPAPRQNALWQSARVVVFGVVAIATILTQSRSATALLGLTLIFALARFITQRRRGRGNARLSGGARRTLPFAIAMLIGALVLASALFAGRAQLTFDRYDHMEDARPQIWEDALYTARQFWPLGSGMGTFDEVFQLDESLEYLDPPLAGRAHNDFIEVAIEAGAIGLALIALWLVWIVAAAFRARSSAWRWYGWASAAGLVVIALQSLTDYPLRSQTLLCVAGMLAGILGNVLRKRKAGDDNSP